MKKLIFILLICLTGTLFSQDPLQYETKSQIETTSNLQVGIGLIDYDLQAGLGISGNILASNINEKYSFEANYNYIYFDVLDAKNGDFSTIDMINLNSKIINFGFGYTISQEKKSVKNDVTLKTSGNTRYYTRVETDLITSYGLRAGIHNKSFKYLYESQDDPFVVSAPSTYDTIIAPRSFKFGEFYQTVNMFYIGVSRKKSVNSFFEFEKYGLKRVSGESELYADLLIKIKGTFSPLEIAPFIGQYSADRAAIPISQEEQDEVFDKFKFLPIGFRVANRFTSRKASQINVEIYGGISPMYYLKLEQTINLGLKISYRFFTELN